MSISINNLLSQFRVQLPILTALPNVVPPGAEFYFNGTKWRGLGAGESSLPEGTPWPVKGYKEYVVSLEATAGNNPVATILENSAGVTANWVRDSAGNWLLKKDGKFDNSDLLNRKILFVNSSVEDEDDIFKIVDGDTVISVGRFDSSGSPIDNIGAGEFILSIRIYPPQP
jgi:hypothetical protein